MNFERSLEEQENLSNVGDGTGEKDTGSRDGFKITEIGWTPGDWEIEELSSIIDIKHGFAFKGEFFTDVPNEQVVLTPGNFNIGGGFKTQKFKYYLSDFPKEYVLKAGDVIVSMTDLSKVGDTLGYSAKIPASKNQKYLHNQRLGLLQFKSKNVNIDFIYWLLRTKKYQQFVVSSATGSTVKHTSPTRIKEYKFAFPPVSEQKIIAEILTNLDEKIELNRQMNTTLEAISQAIFKHWFVDFEFPNEEGKPYKSNGGEMEETELGEVPVGWRVGELNEISTLMMGLSPQSASYNDIGEGFPLLNGAADFSGKIISPKKYTSKPTRICQKDDLLFCIRATIGNITFSNNQYCLGRGVASLTPKDSTYKEFIYFQLNYSLNYLISRATGSVISGLSKPDIENLKIIIPVLNQIDKFHNNMINIFDKIQKNSEENITLPNIRDALLPKFMSGEIRTIDN